jgi:hypothetical protein
MTTPRIDINASHSQSPKTWKQNFSHTKISSELVILVRKFTDRMLGWSDTDENVLRLLKIAQIQHIYLIISQKMEKEFFVLPF